jgi:hypothetical protein
MFNALVANDVENVVSWEDAIQKATEVVNEQHDINVNECRVFGYTIISKAAHDIGIDPLELLNYCVELVSRKNDDYNGNIVDTMSCFRPFGVFGILVRLTDKFSRVISLSFKTDRKVKDESIMDTLVDIMNYACFMIILLDDMQNNTNYSYHIFREDC